MKNLNRSIAFILFTGLLLFAVTKSQAQVQEGDINLGVNTTVSVISYQGTNTTTSSFFFSGQYFITDNISAGASPVISFSGTKVAGFESSTSTVGIGLFGNYNFLLSSGDILPYAGASLLFNNSKTKTTGTGVDSENISRYSNFGINGGAKYFLTERINLDANLSYTFNLGASTIVDGTKFEGNSDGGTFTFTFGLGIILGRRGN